MATMPADAKVKVTFRFTPKEREAIANGAAMVVTCTRTELEELWSGRVVSPKPPTAAKSAA